MRADRLYDVVVPLGWNDGPTVRGRGSAIFWHVARENGAPTAGCVAVAPEVFRKVLPRLAPGETAGAGTHPGAAS